jgi:hypothetical protein
MAFLEMYLNGEWRNLSSFGTVSSVDIQSSSSAISVTGSPITSVGIINLSFNPSAIRLDQFAVPTSNLDINNKNLINVATPTLSHHATNRSYVDSKTWTSSSITDFATSVTNTAKLISLNQFAVPMASLSMNNYRITSVSDPVNPQDVANKLWVENLIAGGGSTINLTGSVIGSGTDTIATSFNRFQTIDNVDNTQTWTYNFNVTTGQSVSYHNTILSDTNASTRKFIARIARKSLTDNQFQWEHDIDGQSISDYQSIKMNFVNGSNNPGTFTVFSANKVNNVITASFNSTLGISDGTLSTHAVTKSQLDNKKLNEFGVNNDVDLGVYKMSSSTAPTQGNHFCNKTYTDNLVSSNITLKSVGFNRGDIVQLDNLRIRMASTGEYNVEVATVSGTMAITYTRDLFYAPTTWAVNSVFANLTTTFSKPIAGNNLNTDGSYYRLHITDTTNNRFYRCTMHNANLANSKIPIILERLI